MSLTDGLNPQQREAVTAGSGPVLVLAGPGSGKTRVLTHRIAYLIREMNVAPWHIMAVTFTNKAAREMRERVERIMEGSLRGVLMGTFHSTCARVLRRESAELARYGYTSDFVIFDADDQKSVTKAALKELDIDPKRFSPMSLLSKISDAKDKLISPEMYQSADYASTIVKRVYEQYQATLVANNAMDFDDLLLMTVRLFDDVPEVLQKYQQQYHHLLVDEFQDTNSVQYSLLTRLAGHHRNLFVVGDSDQSIYKWRGADYRNIQRFREQFTDHQQVLLEQNYRSTQLILDAAKAVIQHNPNRVHKDLFTTRPGGPKIVIREAYNETEEAQQIVDQIATGTLEGREPGDYAVMYRTNAQSRVLEEAFLRRGLPYKLVGAQKFYGRREVKDIIAYLRLIHNLRDEVSFKRIINVPRRSLGTKSVQSLLDWGANLGLQGGEAVVALATRDNLTHPFKGRALSSLLRFGNLLNGWLMMREQASVGDILERVLEQTNYRDYIDDGTDEGADRWANVMEFRGVATDDPEIKLPEFLEQVALVADADTVDQSANAPTLLTLHSSKGLEFPIVFIAGCEEKILPHSRSLEDGEEMAEERRLFYVGLTRAKDKIYLSHAFRRTIYGMSEVAQASRFLSDIPTELVYGGNQLAGRKQQAVERMSEWSWDREASSQRSGSPAGSRGSSASYSYQPRGSRRRSMDNKYRDTKPFRPTNKTVRKVDAQRQAAPPSKNLPRPRHLEADDEKKVVQQFKTGMAVRHGKFGEGLVIESKLIGNDEEVTIAFKEHGIKRLAASFAKLEVVE